MLKKLILKIIPDRWYLTFCFFSGTIVGLALMLVYISNFFSYLSDDPKTCMNCHIMGPQYATWYHSSHREVANCNDCHVPQDNIFKTYFFKAQDGMRHSAIFTIKGEEQAIFIKEAGKVAVFDNCKRCHGNLVSELKSDHGGERLCWDCHRETPHSSIRSLSSTPYAKVPTTDSMIPKWLEKNMKHNEIRGK